MTAPDDERRASPAPSSPEALASGQRTLAAIVFTDTVGFSALMRRDEERALRLVARDLNRMKATCESYGGQVLKSTGDGLLMLFTSAVQAVACALEIQRDLVKKAVELPKDERLQHRIGIHLGDVFQHGGDVMGDGVNIAARLQTEAVPGGICLSNTVYDVVHNRLPFYVNDLGARKLKNIGRMTAYQISPMESASRPGITWYRWRPWIWRIAGLAAAILVIGFVFEMGMEHRRAEWLRLHPASQRRLTENLNTVPSATQQSAHPVASTLQAVPSVATNAAPPSAPLTAASDTEYEKARFTYMRKYDFGGMEMWMQAHDWPGKKTSKLAETCARLDHLFKWTYEQLNKYSQAKPLEIVSGGKSYSFWPVAFGGVEMKVDQRERLLAREQILPNTMDLLINELLKEKAPMGDPQTAVLQQELQLFLHVYRLNAPEKPTPTTTATRHLLQLVV